MTAASILPEDWDVPSVFRRRLGRSVGRQRAMEADGHLLIVAHEVPGPSERSRRGILFWRDPQGVWNSTKQPAADGVSRLLQDYEQSIEGFDSQESAAMRADEYLPLLEGIAPVARAMRNLSEALQEARKVNSDASELIDLRDRAYELARHIELLHQDAKNSMDVAIVRRAEEQATASQQMSVAAHRLNLMAALFLPLATLSAIFGTSLTEGWTWSHTVIPFLIFLSIGLLSGLLLAKFVNAGARP